MPWELTGNLDADIGPDNFLGTIGQDPLRIKTWAAEDVGIPDRPTGKDVVFITPSDPDGNQLGRVGIRTNQPEATLHVSGGGHLRWNAAIARDRTRAARIPNRCVPKRTGPGGDTNVRKWFRWRPRRAT
jgi:hypothetical protein